MYLALPLLSLLRYSPLSECLVMFNACPVPLSSSQLLRYAVGFIKNHLKIATVKDMVADFVQKYKLAIHTGGLIPLTLPAPLLLLQ